MKGYMRFVLRLFGWSGFWKDEQTGKWYGYDPAHMKGYWAHEAERVPLPSFTEWLRYG